jgi:hypothetical protein
MKLVSLVFLGLGLSFSFTASWAADATTCPNKVERHGSIQVQQDLSNNNVCFVSVGNFKTEGGVYRNYLFTSDGELMVFNSYGWGNDSDDTAAREFFFFPRSSNLAFNWNEQSRQLEVTGASGDQFFFDYEEAQLVSMSKAQVQLAADVSKTNKGGVEILKYQGLMMDGGFKIGSAPTSSRSGNSVFKDSVGATCTVKNTALFTYESDGDVIFKYTDKDLSVFLKRICSKLKF